MCFNDIRESKILAKNSEFTVFQGRHIVMAKIIQTDGQQWEKQYITNPLRGGGGRPHQGQDYLHSNYQAFS